MYERPVFQKVVCYVTRGQELLVFRHRDEPEAGLQVPAGTVIPGENPEAASLREAEEETGLVGFRVVRKLGDYTYLFDDPPRHEVHERHVFHLSAPPNVPERWPHFAEGAYWFVFEWVPLDVDPGLAVSQGDLLHFLT